MDTFGRFGQFLEKRDNFWTTSVNRGSFLEVSAKEARTLLNDIAQATELDLHDDEVFLKVYWPAFLTAQAIVDMPDQLLFIFLRSYMINGGALPRAERTRFAKLTDDEIARMEAGVLEAMNTVRER